MNIILASGYVNHYIQCVASLDAVICLSISSFPAKLGPSVLRRSFASLTVTPTAPSRRSGSQRTTAKRSAPRAVPSISTICPAARCGAARIACVSSQLRAGRFSLRDYLAAIAIFTNGAKGYSALQLSRDLDCQYKTAFVLAHKLREAIAAQDKGVKVSGEVEIDGMYAGGYVKPANYKENRRDRRVTRNQNGKRRVVIVARERHGQTITFVSKSEDASLPTLQDRIVVGSTVYADEASHWDVLHSRFNTHRINHSLAYSTSEGCTNMAESFFSRLRRAEIGTHHHIAGPYLAAYAAEMDWREDNRHVSNGEQYHSIVTAAAKHPISRQWKGYWQRRAA
jgi:transposase-like protein